MGKAKADGQDSDLKLKWCKTPCSNFEAILDPSLLNVGFTGAGIYWQGAMAGWRGILYIMDGQGERTGYRDAARGNYHSSPESAQVALEKELDYYASVESASYDCEGEIIGRRNNLVVIDCNTCGYAHLRDRGERREAKDFWNEPDLKEFLDREVKEQWYWEVDHRARLNAFSYLLELPVPGMLLLDYGCGAGHFVKYANDQGWGAFGYEPSLIAVAKSPGIEYCYQVLDVLKQEHPLFACCNLRLVLEHVQNPAELLADACDLLGPGGILCVEVPRDFSELQYAAEEVGAEPYWWIDARHLNYFTSSSLRKLVKSCGFRLAKETTTFPMELFILMGLDYTQDKTMLNDCVFPKNMVGPSCHQMRMNIESHLTLEAREEMLRKFAEMEWGRHIVLFLRKA